MPILETARQHWADEGACAAAAATLARRPALGHATIELHGPLGAGKTTFVRHLLRALGVQGTIKSPTYGLVEPYEAEGPEGRFTAAHFDFYRFDDPQEWEDAGFREIFAAPGLKLVEWPEKADDLLPVPDLRIFIEPHADESRDVRFEANSEIGAGLLP